MLLDNFTDSNGTNLTSHTSDSGHTWAKANSGSFAGNATINANMVVATTAVLYQSNWVPASPDYDVHAWLYIYDTGANYQVIIRGRAPTGTNDGYGILFDSYNSPTRLILQKVSGGTSTTLDFVNYAFSAGQTYKLTLRMRGTKIQGYVNDVLQAEGTDSTHTAAGLVMIRGAGVATNTTRWHVDRLEAYSPNQISSMTSAFI
jgi:hypothetical protein